MQNYGLRFWRSIRAIKPQHYSRLVRPVPATNHRTMSYTAHWKPNDYPKARRSDHVDTYASEARGTVKVPDPYEWLEHDTKETQDWVTAQEQYTRRFLDANQYRNRLEDEIRKSSDYERVSRGTYVNLLSATADYKTCLLVWSTKSQERREVVLDV
jgi:hypothetical protein